MDYSSGFNFEDMLNQSSGYRNLPNFNTPEEDALLTRNLPLDPNEPNVLQLLSTVNPNGKFAISSQEDLDAMLLSPEKPSGKMDIRDYASKNIRDHTKEMPLKKDAATIARVNKEYPEFTASVDKNGQLNLVGVGPSPSSPSSSKEQINKDFNLADRMAAIDQEKDPLKKQAMLTKFQGEVTEYQTKELMKFRSIADQQLGIQQLKQQLLQSEQVDRNHKDYFKHPYDSNETMALRQQLAQFESIAEKRTQNIAMMDPQFAKTAQITTSFLKNQEFLMKKQESMDLQSTEYDRRKQVVEDEKIAALTDNLTPQNYDYLRTMFGDLPNEELQKKAFASYKANPAESRMLLNPGNTEGSYLVMAIQGIPGAKNYILKKQMAAGLSEREASQDVENMRALVADPLRLAKELEKFARTDAERAEVASLKMQAVNPPKDKETRAQQFATHVGAAIGVIARKRQDLLYKDVRSWKVGLQNLPDTADLLGKGDQPISLQDFLTAYLRTGSIEQRTEKAAAVKKIYLQNIAQANKGIYAIQDDEALAARKFDALVAADSLFETNTFRNYSGYFR